MRTRIVLTAVGLALLAGCATAPKQTRNICAVFDERDGLFSSWQSAAERTEKKYGVPVPILMATIRLPALRAAAPHQTVRLHSLDAAFDRLRLFAGARRNVGPLSVADRELDGAAGELRRRDRFHRLVPRPEQRRDRHSAERCL